MMPPTPPSRWKTSGRGLRDLLDAHAENPALAAAQERERLLVRRDLGVDVPPDTAAAHHTRRRPWRRSAA
jgi:hypothetical protein